MKVIYVTYVDRRKLGGAFWVSIEGAIGSIMKEVNGFDFRRFKEIWL